MKALGEWCSAGYAGSGVVRKLIMEPGLCGAAQPPPPLLRSLGEALLRGALRG